MVGRFNASQQKYVVQVEFQGAYGELRDKLTAAAAAGGSALPDVVMISDVMMPVFARNGVLEPLDDMMKSANGIDISDYVGVVERGRVDGKLFQLPLGVSTPIFYYNQDAVKKAGLDGPPKTWDELFDVYIPKLTVKEGGKTSVYGFAFLANADWWWQQSYPWMYGGKLSDDKYNTYFDTEPVIAFLDRFQKRFQAGEAYLPTAADGAAVGYFGSGKANMMIESTGVLGRLAELTKDKFTPGVAYLPQGPAGRMVPTGGMGLSIVSKLAAPKKEAACGSSSGSCRSPRKMPGSTRRAVTWRSPRSRPPRRLTSWPRTRTTRSPWTRCSGRGRNPKSSRCPAPSTSITMRC